MPAGEEEEIAPTHENLEKLLTHADDLVQRRELDAAQQFFEAALSLAPDSSEVLDAFGSFLLEEMDDLERGAGLLERSVEVNPEDPMGFGKYMSLGQLSSGEDAVRLFETGASLVQARLGQLQLDLDALQQQVQEAQQLQQVGVLEGAEGAEAAILAEGHVLRIALAAAYCQCAEIYLTDLCYNDEAEQRCEELVNAALEASGEQDPGPYRLLADLRISQQRNEEALAALQTCFSFWKDADDIDDRPAPEVRDSCAKMFLELGYPGEAVLIYEQLVAEDDTIAEVFHMLGVAQRDAGDLEAAVECLETAQQLLNDTGCDDQTILQEVAEVLAGVEALQAQRAGAAGGDSG